MVLRRLHPLDLAGQRADEVLLCVIVADPDGLHVRVDQVLLVGKRFLEQRRDRCHVDIQQRRQRADISDVLHQDACPRAIEGLVAHLRQRNTEYGDVVAIELPLARPGRVIDQPAARPDVGEVLRISLRIHRNHDVDPVRTRLVAVTRDAYLVPGRQALDVRREIVLADNRDAHAEYRLPEESVCTGGTRAVYGGNLDDDVVDAGHALRIPSGS
jgi:hypothetical protein